MSQPGLVILLPGLVILLPSGLRVRKLLLSEQAVLDALPPEWNH